MARWLVKLSRERADLEEFSRWFPDGEVYAIEEKGEFYLVGPAFETHENAESVLAEAKSWVDKFAAVASLLWLALRKPTVGGVIREGQGKRHAFMFISAAATLRAKANAVVLSGGTPQEQPQQTQAQELLDHATESPHLQEALLVWGESLRSWPRLYRILEEIERHLKMPVDKRAGLADLCSDNKRGRFKRSAQPPEVAGLDARHASGSKYLPPQNPMTFEEASEFIRQILLRVLRNP